MAETKARYSFRDYVKKNGLKKREGDIDYSGALEAMKDDSKSKDDARMASIEAGMKSLRQKCAPGQPPPQGALTINEVLALQHIGINPLKAKAPKSNHKVSGKERARRRRKKALARKARRAQRKK